MRASSRSLQVLILIVLGVVLIGGVFVYVMRQASDLPPAGSPSIVSPPIVGSPPPTIENPPSDEWYACTQEAKQCPDGSYVGRTGPKCEFAPCPATTPLPADCNGPGGSCPSGYTCIQKCGPPVMRDTDPAPGYYCELNSVASKPRMCPICLASNTMIATPSGEVNVTTLRAGSIVWSMNAQGERVASKIVRVSNMDVPTNHQVIHVILVDKREAWLSPNHPMFDGRPVKDLRVGEIYDGSRTVVVDLVPYWDEKTYDLLPDSATGTYFANGILFGSTLAP